MKKDKNNKKNKDKDKDNELIKKYNSRISLIDYYITKNINSLVKSKTEYNFIKNNNYLLGLTNNLGKNSLNILLENSNYEIIKKLIEYDVRIINYKNTMEQNLLQSLITYEENYPLINKILEQQSTNIFTDYNEYNNFKIKILSNKDINGIDLIDQCIELIKLSVNFNIERIIPIISILKSINNLDKEDIFIIITKLCREITNSKLLFAIIKQINPTHIDIYPDEHNYTCIDYLILEDNIEILDYLIDRIDHIYFVNYEENSIFLLLNNINNNNLNINQSHNKLIEIIFRILAKSNINKMKDMYNENILLKLLSMYVIDKSTIKESIDYFDIFEQNINGENIYQLLIKKYYSDIEYILDKEYLIDSQIKYTKIVNINITSINFNLDIKKYLVETHYGLFNSDALHNMIYTTIILERNDIMIPYIIEPDSNFLNNEKNLLQSNNDKDILGLIKVYFYYFNTWLPHLVIWKDKTNYYIHPQLINWLKDNTLTKRFIYLKLSIIATSKIQGNLRHANLILIDNQKKIVERFEPYGEIYFANGVELNGIIETEIANKIGYKFIFIQSYPGFQIRSNEYDNQNKSYGDPGGYCLAWCFLYLELKLYYENEILPKLIDKIKDKKIINILVNDNNLIIKLINNYIINTLTKDFPKLKDDIQQNLYMTFIRYYAKKLDNYKNKLIKKYGFNLSTIYHLNLNDENNKKIISKINKDIEKYNIL